MPAKLTDSTLAINEGQAYSVERSLTSLVMRHQASGKEILHMTLEENGRLVISHGEFSTLKGHAFTITPSEWTLETDNGAGRGNRPQGESRFPGIGCRLVGRRNSNLRSSGVFRPIAVHTRVTVNPFTGGRRPEGKLTVQGDHVLALIRPEPLTARTKKPNRIPRPIPVTCCHSGNSLPTFAVGLSLAEPLLSSSHNAPALSS